MRPPLTPRSAPSLASPLPSGCTLQGDGGGPLFMNGFTSTKDVQYGIAAFTECGGGPAPGE